MVSVTMFLVTRNQLLEIIYLFLEINHEINSNPSSQDSTRMPFWVSSVMTQLKIGCIKGHTGVKMGNSLN